MTAIKNLNSFQSRPVRVRLAEIDDAERIATVINCAFRHSEEFFVDGDRVDVAKVLKLLNTGKFLLAESEGLLLGCVYVEPRPFLVDEEATAAPDCVPDQFGKEDSDLSTEFRNPPSEIRDRKLSRAYLGLLAVDPAHQQSGLGSRLMDAGEDYCCGLGASVIDLIVVSLREELFGFYRRRGYIETGTSPFPAEIATKQPCHFIEMSKPLC